MHSKMTSQRAYVWWPHNSVITSRTASSKQLWKNSPSVRNSILKWGWISLALECHDFKIYYDFSFVWRQKL